MAIPLPLPSVAERVAGIIDALCRAVPSLTARDRSAGPLTILIYGRLRRLAAQFAALVARVAAGTLPASRRRIDACPEMPAARPPRTPRLLPGGFGWLARLVPGAACFGGQLQHLLLTDPEMASLLAAAPQAGGMLRSLLWMTAIRPLPEILRRPARSATPIRTAIPDLAGVPDRTAVTDHVPAAGADQAPPEAPPRSRGRRARKEQPPWLRSPEATHAWRNRLLGCAAPPWPK